MPFRKIARSIHGDAREVARRLSKTPAYRQSRRERKKVEMLFAHLKRILKLDRLRLRGLAGAQDEFLLADVRPDGVLLTPARRKYSLDELVAQCDQKAQQPADLALWDEAKPVGREAW